MRGVVLAGGTGSRLDPVTRVTNKHLLPVGRVPMIYHPLRKLRDASILNVLVVTGVEHMGDVVRLLGSGRDLGLRLTYRVQDEAGGIAQALSLAEDFAAMEPVCVLLGDNVFEDDLAGPSARFLMQGEACDGCSDRSHRTGLGARVLLKEVPDPQRYGVAVVSGGRVERIVEKPADPPSNLAVTGIYFYDAHAFEFIRDLKPSARGELEITDVNNAYAELLALEHEVLQGWWTDAGTHESLRRASDLAAETWSATREEETT